MSGHVYPHQSELTVCGKDVVVHKPGMTFRQAVAKDVMAALTRSTETTLHEIERRAEIAVYAADRLIAALNKPTDRTGGTR